MRFWGWASLGVSFVLAGCGGDTRVSILPSFEVPKLDSDRERFLQSFPLLNEAEEESAPVDPQTGKAPFGVLIHMASLGRGSFCSVAHVSPGRVTTNAHCVSRSSKPEEYFVVFYNQRNWKSYERVTGFAFVGNEGSNDVAVLEITPDVGRIWDTVGGRPIDTSGEIARNVPVLHKATVWSFNPFQGNHPELLQKYRGPGMRFAPKHCDVSRTRPKITGIRLDENGDVVRVNVISGVAQESIHWFVDACDSRPVQGNSGSLITAEGDITQMMGAYHWNIPADPEKRGQYAGFEYQGNNGVPIELSWQDMARRDFFGVGTDFHGLLRTRPGLF